MRALPPCTPARKASRALRCATAPNSTGSTPRAEMPRAQTRRAMRGISRANLPGNYRRCYAEVRTLRGRGPRAGGASPRDALSPETCELASRRLERFARPEMHGGCASTPARVSQRIAGQFRRHPRGPRAGQSFAGEMRDAIASAPRLCLRACLPGDSRANPLLM